MADPTRNLVAVRDARERTIARLTDAFTHDLLDVDEFDRRLSLAHRAETPAEMDALVADLEPPPDEAPAASTALVPSASPASGAVPAVVERRPRRRLLAVFGGVERRGPWTPPRHLQVTTVFGGAVLDFRDAILPPGDTEVHVTSVLGGVMIVVPPTLAVDVDGSAVLGGFAHAERAPATPDPDRPRLLVTGLAVLGGVDVETLLPGEQPSWSHDAYRDRRHHLRAARRARRRALRHGRHLALPPGTGEDDADE